VTSGGRGDTARMERALNESVSSGGYVVDIDAVASAMLTRECIRRVASAVLVPAEALDLAASRVSEDDSAAIGDAA
jgi:predicted kinase